MVFSLRIILLLVTFVPPIVGTVPSQPNIVMIVADDYGWNDVGYHGSEIKTPTLDKLAAEGIKLENYYVQPICTPTRSQLLSGRYQIHTGLQHFVLLPCTPAGLPLEDKTLADKLKQTGYSTHMVGKWHLGMFKEDYVPTKRGFDTFFGYLQGAEDYYKHGINVGILNGLDLWGGLQPYRNATGRYSTHLFAERGEEIIRSHNKSAPLFLYQAFQSVHTPLQVPGEYEQQYDFINDKNRRVHAGMVSAMDEAIMNLTQALQDSGLWENTLLIFTTDNGAQVLEGGNNAPLRGSKATYFEGGIKGVGFLSGPYLKKYAGTVNHQLLHVSDWFPTLINLVGGSMDHTKPDGYDQWETIVDNTASPRKEILYNIDPMAIRKGKSVSKIFDTSVQAALRYGDWKIITGNPGPGFQGWAPEPKLYGRLLEPSPEKLDRQNVYLFNIVSDPEERHDMSKEHPEIVDQLLERLAYWNRTAVPVNYPPQDFRCNPALHNGTWAPWM